MWAFPMRDLAKCDNWDAIEGNRLAMQWVRNAYVGTAEFGRAEYAFVTREYIDQWKIKVNYYPCILA